MDRCAFNILLKRNVPHILEQIFFSLDYESFKKCLEVNKYWKEFLRSVLFQKKTTFVYEKGIRNDEKKLIDTSKAGNADEVGRLLSSGLVDVNCLSIESVRVYRKIYRVTPVCAAARMGHINVVKLLINRGAKPNKEDDRGQTALTWASLNGHQDVVKFLLNKGARPNEANGNGWTPLHTASMKGHKEVVKALLDGGAEVDSQSIRGETPLHLAVRFGQRDEVQLFLDKGADPDKATLAGFTPLSIAQRKGREDLVQLLRG